MPTFVLSFGKRGGILFAALLLFSMAAGPTPAHPRQNQKPSDSGAALLQPPAAAAEKYETVYGQKIYYLEAGSGPVVILLHGLGGDSTNFRSTIGPLSQKYRVIVPDQIGFGRSDKPLIHYRVGTLVDFLDGFMQKLKIDRATIAGNSLGGWTAAAFAVAHPEKVERLVLVDAAGFSLDKGVDPRSLNALNPSTREGVKQVLSLVFYDKQFASNPVAVDGLFTHKMMAGDGYTIQQFIDSIVHGEDVLDNTVSGIKQPTLVVWGREDALVPLAVGQRFHNEIQGSALLILDKCGHIPMIEQPALFNSALMKFLAGGQPEGVNTGR